MDNKKRYLRCAASKKKNGCGGISSSLVERAGYHSIFGFPDKNSEVFQEYSMDQRKMNKFMPPAASTPARKASRKTGCTESLPLVCEGVAKKKTRSVTGGNGVYASVKRGSFMRQVQDLEIVCSDDENKPLDNGWVKDEVNKKRHKENPRKISSKQPAKRSLRKIIPLEGCHMLTSRRQVEDLEIVLSSDDENTPINNVLVKDTINTKRQQTHTPMHSGKWLAKESVCKMSALEVNLEVIEEPIFLQLKREKPSSQFQDVGSLRNDSVSHCNETVTDSTLKRMSDKKVLSWLNDVQKLHDNNSCGVEVDKKIFVLEESREGESQLKKVCVPTKRQLKQLQPIKEVTNTIKNRLTAFNRKDNPENSAKPRLSLLGRFSKENTQDLSNLKATIDLVASGNLPEECDASLVHKHMDEIIDKVVFGTLPEESKPDVLQYQETPKLRKSTRAPKPKKACIAVEGSLPEPLPGYNTKTSEKYSRHTTKSKSASNTQLNNADIGLSSDMSESLLVTRKITCTKMKSNKKLPKQTAKSKLSAKSKPTRALKSHRAMDADNLIDLDNSGDIFYESPTPALKKRRIIPDPNNYFETPTITQKGCSKNSPQTRMSKLPYQLGVDRCDNLDHLSEMWDDALKEVFGNRSACTAIIGDRESSQPKKSSHRKKVVEPKLTCDSLESPLVKTMCRGSGAKDVCQIYSTPQCYSIANVTKWREVKNHQNVYFASFGSQPFFNYGYIRMMPYSSFTRSSSSSQVWTVVRGQARITCNSWSKDKIISGDVITLSANVEYTLENNAQGEFVVSYCKLKVGADGVYHSMGY